MTSKKKTTVKIKSSKISDNYYQINLKSEETIPFTIKLPVSISSFISFKSMELRTKAKRKVTQAEVISNCIVQAYKEEFESYMEYRKRINNIEED